MDAILNFIVVFGLTYFGLKLFNNWLRGWAERKVAELDDVKDTLAKLIHTVAPEQHGDITYWFDADSDAFLGQGETSEEVIAHVKKRFPDHLFLLPNNDVLSAKTEWQPKQYADIDQIKLLLKNDETATAR